MIIFGLPKGRSAYDCRARKQAQPIYRNPRFGALGYVPAMDSVSGSLFCSQMFLPACRVAEDLARIAAFEAAQRLREVVVHQGERTLFR